MVPLHLWFHHLTGTPFWRALALPSNSMVQVWFRHTYGSIRAGASIGNYKCVATVDKIHVLAVMVPLGRDNTNSYVISNHFAAKICGEVQHNHATYTMIPC